MTPGQGARRLGPGLGLWDGLVMLLLLASLGLPWAGTHTRQSHTVHVPGWTVYGACRTVYGLDGWASTECEPNTWRPDQFLVNPYVARGTVRGFQHPGRFGVVGAVALLAVTARRRTSSRWRVWTGLGLLALTTLTAGFRIDAGGVALVWLAAGLLLLRQLWQARHCPPSTL